MVSEGNRLLWQVRINPQLLTSFSRVEWCATCPFTETNACILLLYWQKPMHASCSYIDRNPCINPVPTCRGSHAQELYYSPLSSSSRKPTHETCLNESVWVIGKLPFMYMTCSLLVLQIFRHSSIRSCLPEKDTRLSLLFCTASDRKLGGAWEWD